MKAHHLVIIALLFANLSIAQERNSKLIVHFNAYKEKPHSQVICTLWDKSDGFPSFEESKFVITDVTTTLTLEMHY